MIREDYSPRTAFSASARLAGAVLILLGVSGLLYSPLTAQDNASEGGNDSSGTVNLDIQSDFSDYDKNLGIARASGDVVVKYGDVTIYADQVEYHRSTGNIFARDNVRIFQNGQVVDAEEIIYNINTGELTTSRFKSGLEPVFFTSDNIVRPEEKSEGPITLLDSTFTTHDAQNPNFRVQVRKLEVYPEDKIIMHGAKVFVGNTPIMWLPYIAQPIGEELGYLFTPGWNTAWGGFVLNQYGLMIGENLHAVTHLDYRSERGLAGGVEFKDRRFVKNENLGKLNLYFADDSNPQLKFNGDIRPVPPSSQRYRANLQHRVYFPGDDEDTFYLDFNINRLSDAFVYEDFFPSEFRIDPNPDNLINLNRLFEQGEISLTGRFQLNEFFQTDTRAPELAADIIRTPIGDTGFFYDGLTSYGIIDEEFPSGLGSANGFNRFHTYHEFLHPFQVGGILNVVPRAGAGYTNYSGFDLPGFNTVERTAAHAGVDLSFKMSKRSPNFVNRALGLNGLLHVVKPYLNFSLVSTNDVNGTFGPIDRFNPTTRLRPIDMPLFTAIDDIRDWQIIRTGVSNRWITRRNGSSYEWLSMNNYFDTYLEDPEFNRDFSNFFTDIEWHPLPWLTAATTAQIPLFDNSLDFSEISTSLSFMPTDWFRFGVRHYFLNGHPTFANSDLYALTTYTRLSDNWGFSTAHRFEADDNTLEYQQYSIHRDLASWTASVGGIIRDNRDGENEYGILLSLTLKAFPRVSLPVDFQPGSLGAEE